MKDDIMNHPEQHKLRALVDGLLDAAEAHAIEEHLASCARCRREVSFERNLTTVLRDIPLQDPSPVFDSAVLRAVHSRSAETSSRTPWLRFAAAAVLIAATLIVIVIAGSTGDAQSRTILSPLFEQISAWVQPLAHTLTTRADKLQPSFGDQSGDIVRIFLLATGVLLLVGGLERVLLPRTRGANHRH